MIVALHSLQAISAYLGHRHYHRSSLFACLRSQGKSNGKRIANMDAFGNRACYDPGAIARDDTRNQLRIFGPQKRKTTESNLMNELYGVAGL
ncbi:hypothetical protein JQK88_07280 [Mesorhizobium caraganae]|uniref:hypothetical protein n=1 Tax=Mesorhizobium caraganae TaxID=483206 RepID=UPI0019394F8D|nr:hypothetical protein [Mesorhizobium caraganae]MBM2711052.1 hypothetical protein [Mesorhizobium caraganae]